jgi:hypothetical protein
VVVLPAVALQLTGERRERAVRALARMMATWRDQHADPAAPAETDGTGRDHGRVPGPGRPDRSERSARR